MSRDNYNITSYGYTPAEQDGILFIILFHIRERHIPRKRRSSSIEWYFQL